MLHDGTLNSNSNSLQRDWLCYHRYVNGFCPPHIPYVTLPLKNFSNWFSVDTLEMDKLTRICTKVDHLHIGFRICITDLPRIQFKIKLYIFVENRISRVCFCNVAKPPGPLLYFIALYFHLACPITSCKSSIIIQQVTLFSRIQLLVDPSFIYILVCGKKINCENFGKTLNESDIYST